MKTLFITYTWPRLEWSASARRTKDWLTLLAPLSSEIAWISPTKETEESLEALIQFKTPFRFAKSISPNNQELNESIKAYQPDFVLFDRFVSEEMYGARVREEAPQAFQWIESQDLHFLRKSREEAINKNLPLDKIFNAEIDFDDEAAVRELSSFYRADGVSLISSFEEKLLTERFSFPKEHLLTFPFLAEEKTQGSPFQERKNFAFLGNFRHPPNADAAKILKEKIWPLIREKLPGVECHLYGAFPTPEISKLHDQKMGFLIKGPCENSITTLSRYRALLSPLRFGAGIKGKILDSWLAETPVITTPIGQEGMSPSEESFGGAVARDVNEDFARLAIEIYTHENHFLQSQAKSQELLKTVFNGPVLETELRKKISEKFENLNKIREKNWTGKMLRHHQHRSTLYFSKWIELKERLTSETSAQASQPPRAP